MSYLPLTSRCKPGDKDPPAKAVSRRLMFSRHRVTISVCVPKEKTIGKDDFVVPKTSSLCKTKHSS